MPVPPCLRMADHIVPLARAEAARRLVLAGWSQSRTAGALGVSQAMVSKYQGRAEEQDPLILRLAAELVEDIRHDRPPSGVSPWCATLHVAEGRPGAEEALQDLMEAERMLRDANPIHVMPQVGLNLARAVEDPVDVEDVLAYPARIVASGDRLITPSPPMFGASNHLARCLIAMREHDPSARAIANIRGGDAVGRAVGHSARIRGEGDRIALFAEAARQTTPSPRQIRLIHDEGAVGIEPCLYVTGPTARDVVETILTIAKKVHS